MDFEDLVQIECVEMVDSTLVKRSPEVLNFHKHNVERKMMHYAWNKNLSILSRTEPLVFTQEEWWERYGRLPYGVDHEPFYRVQFVVIRAVGTRYSVHPRDMASSGWLAWIVAVKCRFRALLFRGERPYRDPYPNTWGYRPEGLT